MVGYRRLVDPADEAELLLPIEVVPLNEDVVTVFVRGEVDRLRRAHELLDELETRWRARLERFEDVLNGNTGRQGE